MPGRSDHSTAGRGILMSLLATISYAVVDTLLKYQAREYPVEMIVWARYAVPLAPFAYVQLLWVSILGILVFGDFPDAITLVGMVIVVAGGLLVAVSRRWAVAKV